MENLQEHIRLRLESHILQTCRDICGADPDFRRISQQEHNLRQIYCVVGRAVGSFIQNVNDTASINRLPAELLCHVASYLSRAQLEKMVQTCRSWKSILTSCPSLWNAVIWTCLKRDHHRITANACALDSVLCKAKSPRLQLLMANTGPAETNGRSILEDNRLWPLYAYLGALSNAAPRMRTLSIYSPRASSLTGLISHLPEFPLLDELTIACADIVFPAPDLFTKVFHAPVLPKVRFIRRLVLRGFSLSPGSGPLAPLDFPQLENLQLELSLTVAASTFCGFLDMLPALKRISIRLAENIRFTQDGDQQPQARHKSPRNFDFVSVSETTNGARQLLNLLVRHRRHHTCLEWTAWSDKHPYHLFDHPSGEWVSLALTLRNKGLILDCSSVDSSGFVRSVLWKTKNDGLGERPTSYSPWHCRPLFRHLSPAHLKTVRVNHNHWPALSEGMVALELEALVVQLSPFDDELMLQGTMALPKLHTVRFELAEDESRLPVQVAVLTTFLRTLSCGGEDDARIPRVELDRWIQLPPQDLCLVQALAVEVVVEK